MLEKALLALALTVAAASGTYAIAAQSAYDCGFCGCGDACPCGVLAD